MKLMKKGSRGDDVRALQEKLNELGFAIGKDGIFGDETDTAVTKLQTLFGYTVDAIVGEGTMGLIDAQIGYGWNVTQKDAAEKALRSQGKLPSKEGSKTAKAPAGMSEKGGPAGTKATIKNKSVN